MVLNGKKQSLEDFGGSGFAGPGFASDTCDFVETKLETFNGPTEKVTIDFPNCELDATEPGRPSSHGQRPWGRARASTPRHNKAPVEDSSAP